LEKAKRILFTVAGILSIVAIVAWAIAALCMFVIAGDLELLQKMADSSSEEITIEFFQIYFGVLGGLFVVFAIMAVVNTIFCFKGKNSDSKGIMILNIVFGVLSCVEINIVGAIFGLIARNRKPKAQIEE
jgi:hypothetical protein